VLLDTVGLWDAQAGLKAHTSAQLGRRGQQMNRSRIRSSIFSPAALCLPLLCVLPSCLISCTSPAEATFTPSVQDRLVTDEDLRSAYCIPVLKNSIARMDRVIHEIQYEIQAEYRPADYGSGRFLAPEDRRLDSQSRGIRLASELARAKESRTKLEASLRRLEMYLIERGPNLSGAAITDAAKRGKQDVVALELEIPKCACVRKSAPWDACINECVPADTQTRIRACIGG
jgi:hypothetical protein